MKAIGSFLLLMCFPVNAEILATYTDIESYETATIRLGRVPIYSDFQRKTMIVASLTEPTVIVPPVIDPGFFSRTSRQQMNGCLNRWHNQLNASETTTVLNSISAMLGDKVIINNCIEDIGEIIKATE